MSTRLLQTFRRDNLVFFRHHYYAIQLAIAVVYLLLVLFVLPVSLTPSVTVYAAPADAAAAAPVDRVPGVGPLEWVEAADLEAKVRDNQGTIGVLVGPAGPQRLLFQGEESDRTRALLSAAVARALEGSGEPPAVRLLGTLQEPLGFRKSMVPVLLFLDAGLVGIVFIAAVMFKERGDRVLHALMVSPAPVWHYFVSKAAAVSALALAFGVAFVPLAAGATPNYPMLTLLVGLGAASTALIGAAFAIRFATFQQFFFPSMALINVLGMVPAAAYLLPSFDQAWMRILPTYHFLTGVREAVYPTGNAAVMWTAVAVLAGTAAVFLAVSTATLKTQLVRR